jgi:hypothetical protein
MIHTLLDIKIIRINFSIKFVINDIWIGVYWKNKYWWGGRWRMDFYICILPTIPIHLIIMYDKCEA